MRMPALPLLLLLLAAPPAVARDDTERLDACVLDEALLVRLQAIAPDMPLAADPTGEERYDELAFDSSEDEGALNAEEEDENSATIDDLAARLGASPQAMAALARQRMSPVEFATAALVLDRLLLAERFAEAAGEPFEEMAAKTGVPAQQARFYANHREVLRQLAQAMRPGD